ncbi:hypothetical protein ACHAXN_010303 [Cyclotella atomus]
MKFLSRCYFSGCSDLHVKNSCGRSLTVSTDGKLKSIKDGRSGSVMLKVSDKEASLSGRKELEANISLSISGYRPVDSVTISSYQPFILALKLPLNSKRRRRQVKNASGFAPNLTIIPQSGSLTSTSLVIRTAVAIRAEHPVKIVRIVQLPKSFGRSRRGGSKAAVDVSKIKHIIYQPFSKHMLTAHLLCLNRRIFLRIALSQFNCVSVSFLFPKFSNVNLPSNRERLHIRRGQQISTDGTAWDCCINILPSLKLQNGLPLDISVRVWQLAEQEDDDWQELFIRSDSVIDKDNSSDDDNSAMTPTSQTKIEYLNKFHHSKGSIVDDFLFVGSVESCQVLHISGISLRQPIFMQLSQSVSSNSADPILVGIHNLRIGSKKGANSLPKIIMDLGDDLDALVDVAVDENKVPCVNINSPFWIVNKVGVKLECKVDGKSKTYIDSGAGGLPIMIHGAKAIVSNSAYKKVSRQIKASPLECPHVNVASYWWDEDTNGKLVLKKLNMKQAGAKALNLMLLEQTESYTAKISLSIHRLIHRQALPWK